MDFRDLPVANTWQGVKAVWHTPKKNGRLLIEGNRKVPVGGKRVSGIAPDFF